MRALVQAGVEQAQARSSVDDIIVKGYCFGGAVALEMARSDMGDMASGYATFHGGLSTPAGQSYPAETPPLLIAHGGADSAIPMDDVAALSKELESAGLSYEIQVYSGAPHAFTVFGSGAYREVADRQSWKAFQDFLSTTLTDS